MFAKVRIDVKLPFSEQVMLDIVLLALHDDGYQLSGIDCNEEPGTDYSVSVPPTASKEVNGPPGYIYDWIDNVDGTPILEFTHVETLKRSWILFIPGNGLDCIADYGTAISSIVEKAIDAVQELHPNE